MHINYDFRVFNVKVIFTAKYFERSPRDIGQLTD